MLHLDDRLLWIKLFIIITNYYYMLLYLNYELFYVTFKSNKNVVVRNTFTFQHGNRLAIWNQCYQKAYQNNFAIWNWQLLT